MDTWEKRRDKAAEKSMGELLPQLYKMMDKAGITYSEDQLEHMGEDSFKTGWNACMEDEAVNGLVRALERISQLESMPLDDSYTIIKKHNTMAMFAREALAAFRGEK